MNRNRVPVVDSSGQVTYQDAEVEDIPWLRIFGFFPPTHQHVWVRGRTTRYWAINYDLVAEAIVVNRIFSFLRKDPSNMHNLEHIARLNINPFDDFFQFLRSNLVE
jgi:hypothetical protein